jgi:hypothetical protein
MASTAADSSDGHYACKCLNIHIRPMTPQGDATELIADADFTPVFVGDEGISVVSAPENSLSHQLILIYQAHPQLSVRTRTRSIPIAGSTRCSRYTTITCLICSLLIYRVYQTFSTDVEGKDGPLLPTEDWVERDILKSSSGWVEVHKQCLVCHFLSNPSTMATPSCQRWSFYGGESYYFIFPADRKCAPCSKVISNLFKHFLAPATPSAVVATAHRAYF